MVPIRKCSTTLGPDLRVQQERGVVLVSVWKCTLELGLYFVLQSKLFLCFPRRVYGVSCDIDPGFRPWIMDLATHTVSACALTLSIDSDQFFWRGFGNGISVCVALTPVSVSDVGALYEPASRPGSVPGGAQGQTEKAADPGDGGRVD